MALTARLLARHLATAFTSQSLPAISCCASLYSSTVSCEPTDDTSGSLPTGADHKPSTSGPQGPGDRPQRQQPAHPRERAQRPGSESGTSQADARPAAGFSRSASSQAGTERPSQGGEQRSRGSLYPSQRQSGQAQQRTNPQSSGDPSLPRRQPDRPQSTPPPYRPPQSRSAPAQGSQMQSRSPGPRQDVPRQGSQFQQTDQPGPQQRARSPLGDERRRPNNPMPQQGSRSSGDQQNRFRPRPNFPASRDQQDRAALRTATPPQDFEPHPGDFETNEAEQPRRRKAPVHGRRFTPGPARREGARPGANLRGGGPAKSPSGGFVDPAFGLPMPRGQGAAGSMQGAEDSDDEGLANRRQGGMRHNARGVPNSWKDVIEDAEDQQDLDEARKINVLNRRMRNGEIITDYDQMKNNVHTLQMNLDPRLDVEWGTPVLQEMQVPTADELLEPIQQMLGIQDKEYWQEITEGLHEQYAMLNAALRHGSIKPQAHEATLDQYVKDSMPSDHPMFPVVSQSLEVIKHNPNWNQQKKSEFIWRLVKDLS